MRAGAAALLVVGAAASGAGPAGARTGPPPTPHAGSEAVLRHILKTHLAGGEFVGARIALLDGDGRVTEATAGTTTVDRSSGPVGRDVEWNIGSATKTFVAVVVLQLVDEGALDLDAGIDDFFPVLPDADRITPRQLLQHTSGLAEYIDDPLVVADQQRAWTPAQLIAVAEAAGRVGEPGGSFHYANTNFIILGEIIEQVTGHSWGDEVRTRLAEPLGLTHTREMTDERPVGYQVVDGAFVDHTFGAHPSTGGAAGALLSTHADLLTFIRALGDGALLTPGSQAAMQELVPGEDFSEIGIVHSYGLGLEQYENGVLTVRGHLGVAEAQSSFFAFDAEHGTAVAVTMNVAVGGPQAFMALEALTAAAAAG